MSWAMDPRKRAQGTTNDSPVVRPSFWEEATRVTMAKPKRPNAEGSATTMRTDECCELPDIFALLQRTTK
jgi:hypothetical protein